MARSPRTERSLLRPSPRRRSLFWLRSSHSLFGVLGARCQVSLAPLVWRRRANYQLLRCQCIRAPAQAHRNGGSAEEPILRRTLHLPLRRFVLLHQADFLPELFCLRSSIYTFRAICQNIFFCRESPSISMVLRTGEPRLSSNRVAAVMSAGWRLTLIGYSGSQALVYRVDRPRGAVVARFCQCCCLVSAQISETAATCRKKIPGIFRQR